MTDNKQNKGTLLPTILSVLSILLVIGLIVFYLYQPRKMAYIDSAVLLEEYNGMKDAKTKFQIEAQQWQANIDTLMAELQQGIKDFEKERSSMTQKERELSEELLKTKQNQLLQYQEATKQKAQQEEMQLTQTVLTEVNSFITNYGEQNKFKIIFATTAGGNIAYGNEMLDITDKIVVGLNKQYIQN